MEQTKALNALEPFLALAKSATSPRAAADLVTRATSAPNTFVFAELLEAPHIAALAESPGHAAYLSLLRIFSYGTYATYTRHAAAGGLPGLSDSQLLKLRQLSLLTLARGGRSHVTPTSSTSSGGATNGDAAAANPLSYVSLMRALGLSTPRELEELVISAIYAGLVRAQLDPLQELVEIHTVAPLRDVNLSSTMADQQGEHEQQQQDDHINKGGEAEPLGEEATGGGIDSLLMSLRTWAGRCESTLRQLEGQMAGLREDADRRAAAEVAWTARTDELIRRENAGGSTGGKGGDLSLGQGDAAGGPLGAKEPGKRGGVAKGVHGGPSRGGQGHAKTRPGKKGAAAAAAAEGGGDGGDEVDADDMDIDEEEDSTDANKRAGSKRKTQD